MAIAVDDNVLFKFINGYYTIIVTNLNRIAVFSCFDSCIQSIIRLRTSLCNNLRNKRFCRRSRSRLTAAARAACFALLLISCGCIGIAAAAVVSRFLFILGAAAAVVSGFLFIPGAAVCRSIYIVILSLLNVFTVA